MDEADVLGDRIAIMSQGQLRASGSSFFLKKKFGTGYKLIVVKEPACDANLILDVLQQFAPDAHIESDSQTEVIFVISENHLPLFHNIFKKLEDNSEKLKILSFGCNLTTLEEVFLKLGTEGSAAAHVEEHHETVINSNTTIVLNDLMSMRSVKGTKLILYQIQAMLLKKFFYTLRNYRAILYTALFSVFLIVLFMSVPTITLNSGASCEITIDAYDDTTTVIESDGSLNDLLNNYKSLLGGKNEIVAIPNENMQSFILRKSNESLTNVNRKFIIAATIKSSGIVAWFNGQPYHSLPLTLSMINRAILKSLAGNDHDIHVTNKPFIFSKSEDGNRARSDTGDIVTPLLVFFLLMTHWPSVFIGFYIKERESRAKLLQLISGANRFVYWLTSFLFDFLLYLIIICVLVGIVGAYQRTHLSTSAELGTILIILVFYGIATLPLIYAFSYLFAKHSTGESMVAVGGLFGEFNFNYSSIDIDNFNLSFSAALLYGVYAMCKYLLQNEAWKILAKVIYWVGLMIGPFALLDSLIIYGMSSLMVIVDPGGESLGILEDNIFSFLTLSIKLFVYSLIQLSYLHSKTAASTGISS